MQNMLPSPQPSENSSPSNETATNLSTAYTFPTQLLSSRLKFLKTITQPISLPQTTVSVSIPNSLILNGTSFGNLWMKDMSKFPSVAQMNNKQIISQKVWFLKNLKKIEKVIKAGDPQHIPHVRGRVMD